MREALSDSGLVVDHALRLKVGVGGPVEVEFAEGGVAVALGHGGFEGPACTGVPDDAGLRYPLGVEHVAVGHAQSSVDGQASVEELLGDGQVGGVLGDALAADCAHGAFVVCRAAGDGDLSRVGVEVEAHGRGCAFPEVQVLVGEHAEAVVKTVEVAGVFDEVVAVAVVDADGAVGAAVGVAQSERGFAADDVLAVDVGGGGVFYPGVDGVVAYEVHQGVVGLESPIVAEVVAELGVDAGLPEVEVFHCAVGASVAGGDEGGESAVAGGGAERRLPGIEGAVFGAEVEVEAVAVSVAGDHVEHASHRVGAVEHGGRSAQDLHSLDIFGAIEIGHVVGVDAGELRLPVDHHQHGIGGGASDSADLDAAGASVADSEAEDAALRDEQAGHLSGEGAEQL